MKVLCLYENQSAEKHDTQKMDIVYGFDNVGSNVCIKSSLLTFVRITVTSNGFCVLPWVKYSPHGLCQNFYTEVEILMIHQRLPVNPFLKCLFEMPF